MLSSKQIKKIDSLLENAAALAKQYNAKGSISFNKSPNEKRQKAQASKKMIDDLRKAYGSLSGIDPSKPTYKKLTDLLDKIKRENPPLLKQIALANIKFVSSLAANRVRVRFNESTEDQIVSLMGAKGKQLKAIAKMLKVKGQSDTELSYAIFNQLKLLPASVVNRIHSASKLQEEDK